MSRSKHTPGPWRWESASRENDYRIVTLDGETRCVLYHSACWLPSKADRDLIAAAPDLLEALRAVRVWVALAPTLPSVTHPKAREDMVTDLARLDAAIAKAGAA